MEDNVTADECHTTRVPGAARYTIRPLRKLLFPLPPNARLLDVGCGNGWWSGWLAQQGYSVVGIDPSGAGIGIARSNYPSCRFEQMPVTEGLLQDLCESPFDAVISLEVVEHVYSPHRWARACFAALKPGGRLVCSTPYHGYWKNLAISLINGWDKHFGPLWEGGHIKFWSVATLSRLLHQTGFQVVGVRGAGRLPGFSRAMVVRADRPQ